MLLVLASAPPSHSHPPGHAASVIMIMNETASSQQASPFYIRDSQATGIGGGSGRWVIGGNPLSHHQHQAGDRVGRVGQRTEDS